MTVLPQFPGSFPDPRTEPRSPQDWPHPHLGLSYLQHPVFPHVSECSEPPPDLLGITLPCTRMCSSGINRLYCHQKDCVRSDKKGWVFRRNFGPAIPPSTGWTHQEHRGCGAGLRGPMWLMLGKGECGPAFIPGLIPGKALPARGAGHTVPAKVVNPQVMELLPWHSTAGEHAWAAPVPTVTPLPGALIMVCAYTAGESPSPCSLPPPPPRPGKAGPQYGDGSHMPYPSMS